MALGAMGDEIEPGVGAAVHHDPARVDALLKPKLGQRLAEAVGADATVVEAVHCAATGGTISIVGVNLTMDLPFPMGLVFLKSMTLRTIFAPIPSTWSALVPLVQSGRFTLDETFTHHLGLSEAPRAYELFD